jgi:predicted NBD/HSP70 family sugar kinase
LKKNTTQQRLKRKSISGMEGITIGVDLGGKTSRYCLINDHGEVLNEGSVATTPDSDA